MNTNTVKELKDLVAELGIEATFTTLEDESLIPEWAKDKYAVIARLDYDGRTIEFPYFYSNLNGDFISQGSDEFPSVTDLVWTMSTESDGVDERTFEQWCDEFGYDSDSISKLKMYEELKARAIEWSEFINDSEIEFDLRVSGWEY
jgi:hypothetical protein